MVVVMKMVVRMVVMVRMVVGSDKDYGGGDDGAESS